jgi:Zn-dependent protease with chaperone function
MSGDGLLHDPVSKTTRRVMVEYNSRFPASLRFEDGAGASYDIPLIDLSFSQGGWRGDAVTMVWQREGEAWAVTVDDRQTIANLIKQLPPELSAPILSWQGQIQRSGRWSKAVLTIAVWVTLLPLVLLIALFVMRDRIVDIVIERIPRSVDVEVGERMHRDLAAAGTLVKEGPAVEAMRAVSQRFAPHLPSEFTFRFEVVNDSSVNAFAAPGGLVVVHTGLLAKAASIDQVAGVLSHEIAHVIQRHSMRQVVYNLGLRTTVYWTFGIPEGASATLVGTAIGLTDLKFSRDQETDADAGGMELLEKARLPGAGLERFLEMLSQEQSAVPAFLSTHPADTARTAALGKVLSERGAWSVEPLSIDWNAVQEDADARLKSSGQ